jgi:hypothetical protein
MDAVANYWRRAVRYLPPIRVLCLILLPMAGCGSSGLRFWRGAAHDCEQGMTCDSPLSPTDTVTLGAPPISREPINGAPTIEYADPNVMPDNFRAIVPEMESIPSDPDMEGVPIPTPDPAT